MPPKQPQHIEFDPDLPPGHGREIPACPEKQTTINPIQRYLSIAHDLVESHFAGPVLQNIKYMLSMLMQGEEWDGVERMDT